MILFALAAPARAETDALGQYAEALAWPDKAKTAKLAFKEERTFPFRKFPKRYAGYMYRAPSGDLAIVYESPRALRLVIKPEEILLDKGDGKLEKLPTEGDDARAISDLMRGDLERLRSDWTNEAIDGGLRLTPHAGAGDAIKYIDVFVADGRVSAVEVNQANQATRRYEYGDLTWVIGDEAARPFAP